MLYPGSFWFKRLSKLALLCMVGINLFINEVQDRLFVIGHDMMVHAEVLSDPAQSVAYVLEKSIVPAVSYIEDSRFDWIINDYGIPDAQSLKAGIAHVHALKLALETYAPVYTNLSLVLMAMSVLFWVPIAFAFYWICMDIKRSSAGIFDVLVLIGATWFNFASYAYLVARFDL